MRGQTLQLIDAMAVALMQGYMLVRVRLASHPSPVLRVTALRDQMHQEASLLRRELAVFCEERERITPQQRPHYSPAHRLEILQIMRLRGWSAVTTANRFVLHPNTVRAWLKELNGDGESNRLFIAPVWNRIHDSVRSAVHELRRLCPEPECGTHTIARHLVRAGITIHRSSVQRILREGKPGKPSNTKPLQQPKGAEPFHLLKPRTINRVWHMDLTTVKLLWMKFSVAFLLDGYSRKALRLKVFKGVPNTKTIASVVRNVTKQFGRPRFIITDHGGQFHNRFEQKMKRFGITPVKGKVRCPSFNGKAERFFRTMRVWLRVTLLPLGVSAMQRRLDRFAEWYNGHRPHASLNGRTPDEVWSDVDPAEPIRYHAADPRPVNIEVARQSCRGDPHLPIINIRVEKEAA